MLDQTETGLPPITQEEVQSYVDFRHEIVQDLLPKYQESLPSVLWHYTSGDSLLKIIDSSTMWSTQVSCVNDQVELRYAQSMFYHALKEIKYQPGIPHSSDHTYILDFLTDQLGEGSAHTSEWFITCFSAKKDDLSQWRAYGGGESGYSLGFDSGKLEQSLRVDQAFLMPVCYDDSLHSLAAKKVGKATLDFFTAGLATRRNFREEWRTTFLQNWEEAITYLAPLIKHPKFKDESEWRLVRRLRSEDVSRMKFSQKQTLLARHLPLTFGIPQNPDSSISPNLQVETKVSKILPLTEIVVGPSRNSGVSQISVADLLKSSGYNNTNVPVTLTEVPFQQV
jgi:hypothetical protein